MATPLEALQNKKNTLEKSLGSSSSAYSSNSIPNPKDLSLDKQLTSVNKQIDDLRSRNLRTSWYGPSDNTTETQTPNDGFFMSGLKALQKPLNAVAGAAQYALGKGTKQSVFDNINEATKTGLTFGNILQQEGAPRGVQVPLGFALDVMFDPVNWLTVGTSALIPRAATGLVKGGIKSGAEGALKGFTTGITSNLERKAATAMSLVPFTKKISKLAPIIEESGVKTGGFSNLLSKGAIKYNDLAEKIGQNALTGAEKYDKIIGTSMFDRLNKTPFGFQGGTIGNTIENKIKSIPSKTFFGKTTPSGEEIVDFFKYSPQKAADIAGLQDKVIKLGKEKGIILVRSEANAHFQSIDDFLKTGASIKLPDKIGETMDIAIRDADGVLKGDYTGKIKVFDNFDNAKALLESAGEDYNLKNLIEAYKKTPMGKTGVKWYDDVIDKLKSTTIDDLMHGHLGTGEFTDVVKKEADDLVKTWNSYNTYKDLKPLNKLLTAQENFISLFKSAKVPMNPASHVVATIGNFFMGTMMGLPMWKPEYLKAMTEANLLVKGRLGANGFKEMFFNDVDSLINMADNNPTKFKQLTGMDASEVANKLSIEQKVNNVINENTTKNELLAIFKKAADEAMSTEIDIGKLSKLEDVASESANLEKASRVNKTLFKEQLGSYPTASEQTSKLLKEAPLRRAEEFGSYTTGEITHNQRLQKIKDWIAKEAETHKYNPAYRIANTIANSMPKWYEHIDQSFKIGTQTYLTRVGLTEQELKMISRTIPIDGTKDLLRNPETGELITNISNGQKLYRLTQLKASEVATEAFMNYAAMPDFVRVMRALPIVGSPFLSFPYAMAVKTSKTLINNPAIFNKLGFLINEMNASRTPQEKAAMQEKYNQYLQEPTIVKVFGMWNTNVKNLIPYYQMNMFNPSDRKYNNSTEGKIMQMMDKFPIMQDPIGAVIRDYFIQPWILSGSGELTQGQFGEPLYPNYDEKGNKITPSLGTKALYATRSLAESLVPGAAGFAGLVNIPGELSPEVINLVPSYGFRNLANATQGRSSIGAITKEDAVRKTLRSLLGRSGLPAYTLDTTKTTTK